MLRQHLRALRIDWTAASVAGLLGEANPSLEGDDLRSVVEWPSSEGIGEGLAGEELDRAVERAVEDRVRLAVEEEDMLL